MPPLSSATDATTLAKPARTSEQIYVSLAAQELSSLEEDVLVHPAHTT